MNLPESMSSITPSSLACFSLPAAHVAEFYSEQAFQLVASPDPATLAEMEDALLTHNLYFTHQEDYLWWSRAVALFWEQQKQHPRLTDKEILELLPEDTDDELYQDVEEYVRCRELSESCELLKEYIDSELNPSIAKSRYDRRQLGTLGEDTGRSQCAVRHESPLRGAGPQFRKFRYVQVVRAAAIVSRSSSSGEIRRR
jgi:hypothetical protein